MRSVRPITSRRLLGLALNTAVLVGMVGCATNDPQNVFSPVSELSSQIGDLFSFIIWIAIGVFVIVETALVLIIIRYRGRAGQPRPPQVHGNTRLEIAWTLTPAIILAVITVPTVATIFRTYSGAPANALQIQVVGHQWWWEVKYPNETIVTANEIHVPVGRPVSFHLTSADVIHSFWVPRLAGKRDVIPGRTNELWFTPSQTGTYDGQCAEFCGAQHANMRLRMMVDPPDTYQAWVQSQGAPPAQPAAGSPAAQGLAIYSGGACVGCHTVQGISAGVVGPNLTHFGSRTTVGAAVLDNTPANLRLWTKNPGEVKPGALMPANLVPDQNLDALVAYLESLK